MKRKISPEGDLNATFSPLHRGDWVATAGSHHGLAITEIDPPHLRGRLHLRGSTPPPLAQSSTFGYDRRAMAAQERPMGERRRFMTMIAGGLLAAPFAAEA